MKSLNRATPCECLRREFPGEPDAGKLHVRFDEGGVGRNAWHAASEPQRGNSVTDVCRSLNTVTGSSTLPPWRENGASLPSQQTGHENELLGFVTQETGLFPGFLREKVLIHESRPVPMLPGWFPTPDSEEPHCEEGIKTIPYRRGYR